MPKFSIIIPVYNSEAYLKKCLDSVIAQDYKNYEIIIVNDGSTDDSYKIINEICKKNSHIKYFDYGSNKGLSYARNYGVSKAKGDYLLFLDSDDYYSDNFLNVLSESIEENDVVRFQCRDIFDDGSINEYNEESFSNMNGINSFNRICHFHYVELACLYCYKRKFWLDNGFKFKDKTYHEDFGLVPFILVNSSSTKCISFIGYNYIQRSGSIMSTNNYDKVLKKCNDFLEHFKFLKENGSKVSGNLSIYNSFIANSVILKSTCLVGNDYKNYIKELKRLGAFDMLLSDTFGRKIKRFFIRISPKLYYKLVRR